jgi:hypothetical protein
MKHLLYKSSESNIAGFDWDWHFFLNKTTRGSYTLSCKETGGEPEYRTRIPSKKGIRTGEQLYDLLMKMIEETNIGLDESNIDTINEAIRSFESQLGDEFHQARTTVEKREETKSLSEEKKRSDKLERYQSTIEEFLKRFSDQPMRPYGTKRGWARNIIKTFILTNGQLPTGLHNGIDFTDLTNLYNQSLVSRSQTPTK